MKKTPDKTNRPIRLLHIEDDISSRLLIKKVLKNHNFELLEAPTGLSGLELATQKIPDIILMDINLPDISGIELATKIKNTAGLERTVIIALTALPSEKARDLTLLAGCDGFLEKPIDPTLFPEQILKFAEGKREQISTSSLEQLHNQYEATLVNDLTQKVKELEKTNLKLKETSLKLQAHSSFLEKILEIISDLSSTNTVHEFVNELLNSLNYYFHYDTVVFLEFRNGGHRLKVKHAIGLEESEKKLLNFKFIPEKFGDLFKPKQVVFLEDPDSYLESSNGVNISQLGFRQLLLGFLGTSLQPETPDKIRRRLLPQLSQSVPRLFDQVANDEQSVLDRLTEYFRSEYLYRGGFVLISSRSERREVFGYEAVFLETLFRSASYMLINLTLMEQLRNLFIHAEREAVTDFLTGLYNYRYFMRQLNAEISRDTRHRSHFSLIMLDIDHFKNYNDRLGHQAGDEILKRIAEILTQNTRHSDIVARYGGEEFIIICPELDLKAAFLVAEKLRQIVANTPFPGVDLLDKKSLTISLGVAVFPDHGSNSEELIRSVDSALYHAKKSGRNTVCLYSKELHPNEH
ncbi:MAG: hypothetical protein Kow0037_18110 [Calditrichia bacterium]